MERSGAVKTEFVKFGGMMDTLHRQLNTAANTIGGDGDSYNADLGPWNVN